jgi:hypothetical protein
MGEMWKRASISCAVAVLSARVSFAGVPAIQVEGAGDCPAAAQVAGVLSGSMPDVKVGADRDALPIWIEDGGPSYRVSIGTIATKEFSDTARNCAERAKAAAVFIAVTLGTASIEPPAEPSVLPGPPPEPPPAEPLPLPITRDRPPPRIDVAIAGVLGGAPSASILGGGAARLAIMWNPIGFTIGVTGLGPTTLSFPRGRAQLVRVPIDLSARAGLRRGSIEGSLDLGLALGPLVAEGEGVKNPDRRTALDFGIRGAADFAVWVTSRVAIATEMEVTGAPLRYPLALEETGIIGETPVVWVTGQLAIKYKIQ